MFGTLRFVLALMVAWYHLVDWRYAGPVAVVCFFCLSGYLMTKIVNETYSDGLSGFGRYVANRALRIYPGYYAALALAGLAVAIAPDAALQVSDNFQWPAVPLTDILIFGHEELTPSLLPQAWSLAVELAYYVLIGAILGRYRMVAVLWLVFSLEITVGFLWRGTSVGWFRFTLLGSSLPFAIGACLYHFRELIPRLPLKAAMASILPVTLFGLLVSTEFGRHGGLFIGLALGVLPIALLSKHRAVPVDTHLGALAYPIFLLHYPAGGLAIAVTGGTGAGSDVLAFALTLAGSYLVIWAVERPIEALRATIR